MRLTLFTGIAKAAVCLTSSLQQDMHSSYKQHQSTRQWIGLTVRLLQHAVHPVYEKEEGYHTQSHMHANGRIQTKTFKR